MNIAIKRQIIAVIVLWLCWAVNGWPQTHRHTLNIGLLALDPVEIENARWQALAHYLESRFDGTAIDVKAFNLDGLDRAISARQVDVVITNPASYLKYVHQIGLSAPLAGLVNQGPAPDFAPLEGFGGVIIVKSNNTAINRLQDLKGKTIAVADPGLMGGFLTQAFELAQIGIDISDEAKIVSTGLPFDHVVDSVLSGSADAAFLRTGFLEAMAQRGKFPAGTFKVINARNLADFPYAVSTRLYPERPVATMPHVDTEIAKRIAGALLDLTPGNPVAQALGIHGFTLAYDYESVRELSRKLRLPPYEHTAPISPHEIWRDHGPVVIALGLAMLTITVLLILSIRNSSRLARLRKQEQLATEALSTERARLNVLIRALPDLVFFKDTHGVHQLCNAAFENFIGRSNQEIIGKTDFDLFDAELASRFREQDISATFGAKPFDQEESMVREGREHLFQTRKIAIRNQQGQVIGVLGVASDITELRQTAKALTERVKEQHCLNRVLRLTEDSTIALEQILTDVVQALPGGWLHPESAEACIEWQGRHFSTQLFEQVPEACRQSASFTGGGNDHGTVSVGYLQHYPELDEGPFLREERILIDAIADRLGSILGRRHQFAEAQKRQAIFEAIVSQASYSITLVDAETLGFVEFNNAACEQLGYSREEFAGLTLADIQGEFDQAKIRQLTARFEEENSAQFETLRRTKSGQLQHVAVSLKAIVLGGRHYLSLMWTDISERVAMEAQLKLERERLQNIIDATHAGTWEWNLQNGEAIFNERWAEIFGYRLEELQPFSTNSWERFVHPEDLQRANTLLAEHLAGKSDYYSCDLRMRHRDGHWVWIADRGRISKRSSDGKPLIISGTHVDISSQCEAEEQLRQSEQRFRKLFEDSKQPVLLVENGRFIDANKAALELMAMDSLDQLLNTTPVDISPPYQPDGQVSANKVVKVIDDAFHQGSNRFEWEHIRRNGEHFIAEVMLTPIRYQQKQLLHVVWTDITERKRLEEQTKRFEAIVKSSEDAIISKNLDGIVTSWNPGAAKVFGYSAEEMLGQSLLKLVPPEFIDEESAIIEKIKQGQTCTHYETKRICKDGHQIDVSVTISPIRDQHGKIIGASKIARDITQRKQNQEQLNKLSLTVEQSLNIVVITNLDAEIEYVNPRFTEVTGYSAEEVIGQNPRILKSGRTPPDVYDNMWQTLTTGSSWHGELINRGKDGREFTEWVNISPLRDPAGTITHYVAIKEDITQKKRDTEELERYRKHLEELVKTRTAELETARHAAEVANQSKSAFLANMSHEIRTPMNAVIGYAHLLRSQCQNADHGDKLDRIIASGKHLLGIINDILDLSKIEAQRLTLEKTTFLIAPILDHIGSMMTDRIVSKGLQFVEETDPRLNSLPLVGDPLRIGQILVNYLSNAAKFTERGTIILRTELLKEDREQVTIKFSVEDTGIGIDAAHLDKLFQDFEQAEASTTRRYGGSGLGLAISRRLANLMGGETGVTSKLGKGSVFWAVTTLNRGKTEDLPKNWRHEDGSKLRGNAHVLLAEDNEINQEVAKELLQGFGLKVDIANHGGEAVAMMQNGDYDLILMDMQMPVMDGLEACRQIRASAKGQNIPILAMTANAFAEDRSRCLDAGMNDHIVKPVEPNVLYAKLAYWLPATPSEPGTDSVSNTSDPAPPQAASKAILDTARALAQLSGNIELYQRMLAKFIDQHGDDAAMLRRLLAAGNRDEARRLTHTLKGLAGTLGATELQHTAALLEHLIGTEAEQPSIEQQLKLLAENLAAPRNAIASHLTAKQPTASPPPTVDLDQIQSLTESLLEHLKDGNIKANKLWLRLAPLIKSVADPAEIGKLERLIENYDFPEAWATLRDLADRYLSDKS